MAVRAIPLAELGLETVAQVSARKGKGWAVKTIQNRVAAGELPAVVVGTGRGAYLLRTVDVDAYQPPGQGRGGGSPAHTAPRKRSPRQAKPDA